MEQETKSKKRVTRTVWFWILMAVGTVVAVCAIAVLVDALVFTDEVHPGVSVYGVDLGGMTKGQATAALTRLVDSAGPVTLKSGDKTWSVTPADAGTAMDVKGAVAQAMAVSRAEQLLRGRRHPVQAVLQRAGPAAHRHGGPGQDRRHC